VVLSFLLCLSSPKTLHAIALRGPLSWMRAPEFIILSEFWYVLIFSRMFFQIFIFLIYLIYFFSDISEGFLRHVPRFRRKHTYLRTCTFIFRYVRSLIF